MASPDDVFFNPNFGAPREDEVEYDDDANTETINDVESLKKGIIKTSKNKVQAPYTILLVGETGVGKSAFLEFLANVLTGNDIDNYRSKIDRKNEQDGSENQSQTNSACLYKLTSNNGIGVCILDTPGLADTRGIEQDELYKRDINTKIQKHLDSVTAVLILANGTVPRLTVGTDYALSTLSAIFPKSLADNIALVFTNVPSLLSLNFSEDSIPEVLIGAARFFFDNPVALQQQYLVQKEHLGKKRSKEWDRLARARERAALEMLVELFDWLDGLESQPTTEVAYLYNLSQSAEAMIANTLAQIDQAATKKAEIDKLIAAHKSNPKNTYHVISNFEKTITEAVWKQHRSPTVNMICGQSDCYSNCYIDHTSNISRDMNGFFADSCDECGHSPWNHHRCKAIWKQEANTQAPGDLKEWESAKDGTEKTEILLAVQKKVLHDLDQIINDATDDLVEQVERYAHLSLSGRFSTQVENAVRLLEQNYCELMSKGVGHDHLQRVKGSLDNMRRKLEILNMAKENARKGRVEIGNQRGYSLDYDS